MNAESIDLRVQPDKKTIRNDPAEPARVSRSAWIRERLWIAVIRDHEDAAMQLEFVKPFASHMNHNAHRH